MKRLPTRETDRLQLEVEQIRSAAEIFRSMPRYASPTDFAESLRALLADDTGRSLLVEGEKDSN